MPIPSKTMEGVDEALTPLRARLQEEYGSRRPRSNDAYRRALAVLPGGNSRSQLYFPPFPFYVTHAEGPILEDLDGFEYVDLVCNYTSLVHGHAPREVVAALSEQVAAGTAFGAPTELEIALATEICERVPSVERVRFANSGTEAVYYALRAARAFTGRDRIIKVEGGYSGGVDPVQVSVKHLGERRNDPVPEPGIPGWVAEHTSVIPFDDVEEATRIVREVGPTAAALVIEPLQGSAGSIPAAPGFLEALREATREVGALLIFDEVMTLRLAYGGAQEWYGVAPDLTAMGKIIGGGLPIGAFGGRSDVMSVMDPRSPSHVPHSGTFNANPATLAAGLATLRRLDRPAIDRINEMGDRFRDHLEQAAREAQVPLVATGMGSLLQVHTGSDAPRSFRDVVGRSRLPVDCFFYLMLAEGVFTAPLRGLMAVSTAIGEEEAERVEAAMDAAVEGIARALRDWR